VDSVNDGTTTFDFLWQGCEGDAVVRHLRIEGGGHTWPQGFAYRPEQATGPITEDWGNDLVWAWLAAQRR
jgi:polyhydroxybutyrate depolymerase